MSDDEEKERLKNLKLKDIFAFTWKYWRQYPTALSGASGLMVVATLCDIFIPVYSGRIVDALAKGTAGEVGQVEAAYWALGGFAVLAALHHIFRIVGIYIWIDMGVGIMKKIVDKALWKVSRFSTDWHNNSFAGATVRKITRGKWAFDQMGDILYMQLLPALMVLFGITIIQAWYWPLMGLVFFTGFSLYMALSVAMSVKYVAPANRDFVLQDTRVGAALADTITCNAVVKSFGAELREDAAMQMTTSTWQRLVVKAFQRMVHTDAVQSSLLVMMLGTVVSLALWRWAIGASTAGDVSFVMSSYFIVNGYIRNIGGQIRQLQRSINEMEDIVEFDMAVLDVADKPSAQPLVVEEGQLVFEDVTFSYDSQQDPIYKDFNVVIKPGEVVGLVGKSGSGKSTFVKLIQRLYDVNEGLILIDGQNIADVTQTSLRSAISVVPQDPILFHRSLAENIAYAQPEAAMDDIIRAAKLAHAHAFIDVLPDGYDTMVGERGVKLSGGERQRVAIARAILADKPILIMDEATSSLDSVSEALIQDAIENLVEGRTTIMIAHRLSTIQSVDRILVFDQGRIVEQGSHRELLDLENGYYRELFEKQTLGLIGSTGIVAA